MNAEPISTPRTNRPTPWPDDLEIRIVPDGRVFVLGASPLVVEALTVAIGDNSTTIAKASAAAPALGREERS